VTFDSEDCTAMCGPGVSLRAEGGRSDANTPMPVRAIRPVRQMKPLDHLSVNQTFGVSVNADNRPGWIAGDSPGALWELLAISYGNDV